jgi:hypothetical protein
MSTRSALLIVAVAAPVAACNSTATSESRKPAANYMAAMAMRSVINPAGLSTDQLMEASAGRRLSAFTGMLRKAGEGCTPNAARITERSPDGRSLWNVSCRGNTTKPDYVFFIPASADKFANILRCQPSADGGGSCSAF